MRRATLKNCPKSEERRVPKKQERQGEAEKNGIHMIAITLVDSGRWNKKLGAVYHRDGGEIVFRIATFLCVVICFTW